VRFQRELIAGDVCDSIVSFADAIDADLIVVGERPRRHWIVSNVPRWVARHSSRAVLVARASDRERVAA
jgi:nucleotide-binding universal stress UspA family protein